MLHSDKTKSIGKKITGIIASTALVVSLGTSCNPGLVECDPIDPFCNMDLLLMYGLIYSQRNASTNYQSKYLLLSFTATGIDALRLDPDTGLVSKNLGPVIGMANVSVAHMFSDPAGEYLYFGYNTMLEGYKMLSDDTFQHLSGFPQTLPYSIVNYDFDADNNLLAVNHTHAATTINGSTAYGRVNIFNWNSTTGSLALRPETPFGLGCTPNGPLITPDGKGVIAAGPTSLWGPYGIMSFSRADSNSAFALSPNSPRSFGNGSSSLSNTDILSPDGNHYYYYTGTGVSHYGVDPATKETTYIGEIAAFASIGQGNYPGGFTLDGKYLFDFTTNSPEIRGFSWDSSNGDFGTISGYPMVLGGINYPKQIEIDPSGRFIYILGDNFYGGGLIKTLEIQSDGSLVELGNGSLEYPGTSINKMELVTEEIP